MIYRRFVHWLAVRFEDLGPLRGWQAARWIRRILLPRPRKPVVLPTLHGVRLGIDPVRGRGVELSLYDTGTYERGTLKVISRLVTAGDMVVDAGANIGWFSVYLGSLVKETGKVLAVEAQAETAELLQENIRLNGLENVQVLQAALGEKAGAACIYEHWKVNRGAASLFPLYADAPGTPVEMMRLDDVVSSWPRIDMMKLDIEGSELPALRGACEVLSRPDPPWLVVENSNLVAPGAEHSAASLFAFLAQRGFRIFKSRWSKQFVAPLEEVTSAAFMPGHDNIYAFTAEHLSNYPADLFAADGVVGATKG